ncbi:MAG: DUF5367 family protein [Cyclobacteriaceae bacterium]
MNIKRAMLTGSLVWLITFTLFSVYGAIPGTADYIGLLIGLSLIPVSILGASIYFKKATPTNGLLVAITMVFTAVSLDMLITVPFYEIPYNNGSYQRFLSDPLLWALVGENIITIYTYWYFKIRSRQVAA